MNDLLYGISAEKLQEITGEELKVIRQWKKGTKKPSEPATRLINLFAHGKACALLGNGWNGFYFKNGLLYVPERNFSFSSTNLISATVTIVEDITKAIFTNGFSTFVTSFSYFSLLTWPAARHCLAASFGGYDKAPDTLAVADTLGF